MPPPPLLTSCADEEVTHLVDEMMMGKSKPGRLMRVGNTLYKRIQDIGGHATATVGGHTATASIAGPSVAATAATGATASLLPAAAGVVVRSGSSVSNSSGGDGEGGARTADTSVSDAASVHPDPLLPLQPGGASASGQRRGGLPGSGLLMEGGGAGVVGGEGRIPEGLPGQIQDPEDSLQDGAVAGAGAVAAAWLPGVGEVPSAGARRAVGSMGGASGVAPCVVAA